MKQKTFEEHREAQWSSFSKELDGFKQGYRMQHSDRATDFVEEYQRLTRDLSVAKARGYSRRLIASLNALVIRGHNVIYVYRAGFFRSALKFLVSGFPGRVRRERGYVFVAAAMFLLPLLAMVITILQAPEWVYSVMSASQVSGLEAMYDPSVNSFGRERQSDSDFQMFGFYILNNVSIAFQLFASGLLFGLGSVAYLAFNGVFIGAAAGHLLHVGYAQTFLSFVAGHGSFELTAIVLAGAGGLMLGHALIAPGERSRLGALRLRARSAVEILMGAGIMLLIAAFIEAFWSSSSFVVSGVKYVVGVTLWVLVLGYLMFSGRQRVVV
ncbi:MAG: stage II sporulation protein M [Gammaproteobacteria bacterium]|nr:stage II sporulation protein M [Gammaproteobacteria bacterium]